MKTLIKDGLLINEGRQLRGSIIINDDRIESVITDNTTPRGNFDLVVDAAGACVLPGVIDSHVHFREPGLTHKATIASESAAAVCGGVTSYFDMPNTNPQTTDGESLAEKHVIGKNDSVINYSFFPGATNDNVDFLRSLNAKTVPGIKLFMGSSTGNMLVDRKEALQQVFQTAAEKHLVLMAHCEDTAIINANMARYKEQLHTDDPAIEYHPLIRSTEACVASSQLGASLSHEFGTPFHLAHVTTAQELNLLGNGVTGEVCVAHLLFSDEAYAKKGALIKCNPAIKTETDRRALIEAVREGKVTTVSTDHAPHLLSEKQGGAARAMSGMPMLQFSLCAMLTLADNENIPLSRIVELMCHNQAKLFGVRERGYLRPGYKADIAIVRPEQWTVTQDCIKSKCGWSPLEGEQLKWKVTETIVNGHLVYANETVDTAHRGEEIEFERG